MTDSTRRLGRMTATGATALGIASVVAAAAWGHIPGAGNGIAPTTNGPDLRSVEVFSSDLNDGLPEQARYCFDQNLASVVAGPAGGYFALQTYDSRRTMNPTLATRDTGNERCAIASFVAGTDVTQATVGEVVPGAVSDLQSRTNTIASEPATGSAHSRFAGATTGPDLVDVAINATDGAHKRLTYVFDENLNPSPGVAYDGSNFGFYNGADAAIAGPAGGISVSGKTATVDFLATAGVETASRFFINTAAVEDRPQTAGVGVGVTTPSSPDVLNKGAASASKPEMTAAAPIGAQDFKITFNVPIQFIPASAAGFYAISDGGTSPAAGTAIGTGGTPNTVIVTFPPGVANDPTGIVRIFLAPNSVTTIGGALANLGGQAATSTPNSSPGFTNGPDLLSVAIDAATSRVSYRYDESVQDSPVPAAGALQAAAVDGAPINALGGVVVSGNVVTALFPPSVGSAVLFANPFNSVADKMGRPNPHQSVSNIVQTGAAPPPPPPPPPPAAKQYKTSITIHRSGRVYYGTVGSYRASCKRGRRVLLKRNGIRFGSALTSSKGRYRIKRVRRLGGRVYVHAPKRGKSVICKSKVSRKIRG